MSMTIIHISESEAASDFAGLIARVRAGAEVIVETDAKPLVVLRPATGARIRLLSESIALAKAHGSTATI